MTLEFMRGVVEGTYWLPRTGEIRLANCADMPTKYEILNMLSEVMMNNES